MCERVEEFMKQMLKSYSVNICLLPAVLAKFSSECRPAIFAGA